MAVAEGLNAHGMATLLFDLLTSDEEADRANVFDIPLLAGRVVDAVDWISHEPLTRTLRLGLFGATTGARAALVAATRLGDRVGAIVSRGGRPDLAGDVLDQIYTPTLLIVAVLIMSSSNSTKGPSPGYAGRKPWKLSQAPATCSLNQARWNL